MNEGQRGTRLKFLMCRSCGVFVQAVDDDGALTPINDECPSCGGQEFKDNGTGTVVRTDG